MNYLDIINPGHPVKRNLMGDKHIETKIESAEAFKHEILLCHRASKTPVFTHINITSGELDWPPLDGFEPEFNGYGKDIIIQGVTINSSIVERELPERITLTSSIINGDLVNNNFKKSNYSQNTFNKRVSCTDFQRSDLSNVLFNDEVSDCSFINARLHKTAFNARVTGFTCFSGADFNGVEFSADCDNTVIFIGSNLSEQAIRPTGGIQTVDNLKTALNAGQYTDVQVEKLHSIFSLACIEVEESLDVFSGMRYHLNENHYDHINQAKETLEEYMQNNRLTPGR